MRVRSLSGRSAITTVRLIDLESQAVRLLTRFSTGAAKNAAYQACCRSAKSEASRGWRRAVRASPSQRKLLASRIWQGSPAVTASPSNRAALFLPHGPALRPKLLTFDRASTDNERVNVLRKDETSADCPMVSLQPTLKAHVTACWETTAGVTCACAHSRQFAICHDADCRVRPSHVLT
jgi:hypothetical protein